jgi:integrase
VPRGHVRKRGDAWELRVSAGSDPVTGRRRVVTRTFYGSRKAADKALTKLLGELDDGAHRGPDASLGTLLDRWWAHASTRWAPATRRGYATYRRTYLDPHRDRRVAQVTPEWLDHLYADLLRSHAPATVYKVHTMLRDALGDAVRWGWLAWNPADRAEPPSIKRRPLHVPARDDIGAAIAQLADLDPDYATLVHLQAVAGLRRAELAGLQWRDVRDGELHVRRNVVLDEAGKAIVQPDTKSHRARRITLDGATLALLEDHAKRWDDRAEVLGITMRGEHYLFPRLADPREHMTPGQISQRWGRWRGRLGLDGVRLHDFRHAMVTHLLDEGIPVHDVAQRAGHANGNVTLAIYAHPTTAGARRAGEAAGL